MKIIVTTAKLTRAEVYYDGYKYITWFCHKKMYVYASNET